jgi:hypothetical protein
MQGMTSKGLRLGPGALLVLVYLLLYLTPAGPVAGTALALALFYLSPHTHTDSDHRPCSDTPKGRCSVRSVDTMTVLLQNYRVTARGAPARRPATRTAPPSASRPQPLARRLLPEEAVEERRTAPPKSGGAMVGDFLMVARALPLAQGLRASTQASWAALRPARPPQGQPTIDAPGSPLQSCQGRLRQLPARDLPLSPPPP